MTLNSAHLTGDNMHAAHRRALVNALEAAAIKADRLRAAYVFAKPDEAAAAMEASLAANEALHQARAALLYPVTR